MGRVGMTTYMILVIDLVISFDKGKTYLTLKFVLLNFILFIK